MKTIIKKVIGVILIIYGIFALLTPFTPGSWLALIGMELLGIHFVFFNRFLNEKQRAALHKFMAKFHFRQTSDLDKSARDGQVGINPSESQNTDKSDKTGQQAKNF